MATLLRFQIGIDLAEDASSIDTRNFRLHWSNRDHGAFFFFGADFDLWSDLEFDFSRRVAR